MPAAAMTHEQKPAPAVKAADASADFGDHTRMMARSEDLPRFDEPRSPGSPPEHPGTRGYSCRRT